MSAPTFEPARGRTLLVTGHPNHELAILGFVQRARPFLLFLTDGGHQRRIDESRRALDDLGLLDRASFLEWSEDRLYAALLARDAAPFVEVARHIRAAIERVRPEHVLAEAVELYNPLHDVTAPLVSAALAHRADVRTFEFPLIAQSRKRPESYRVQRLARDRRDQRLALSLSAEELAIKLGARRTHYRSLREQMGAILETVPEAHFAVEEFAPLAGVTPTPCDDLVLRYERRGRGLQHAGVVRDVITYADHFLPVVDALRSALA